MKKELTIPAETERLGEVLSFTEGLLEEAGCPLKVQMQLAVAVEEIFVNIAHYAYAPDTGSASITLEITEDPKSVRIGFADSGKPFDPVAKSDPDVNLSAEERKIGGLGIFMAKKAVDEMRYEYRDGQNRLTLIKKIG